MFTGNVPFDSLLSENTFAYDGRPSAVQFGFGGLLLVLATFTTYVPPPDVTASPTAYDRVALKLPRQLIPRPFQFSADSEAVQLCPSTDR